MLSMEQRLNYAAVKDAQIESSAEECAEGMGHIAIQTMNPLHLDHYWNTQMQLDPYPTNMLLKFSRDEVDKVFLKRWPYSVKKYTKFKTCSKVLPYSLTKLLHHYPN